MTPPEKVGWGPRKRRRGCCLPPWTMGDLDLAIEGGGHALTADGRPPEGDREPPDPGAPPDRRGRRRPAVVFIPRGPLGRARALDFAVTSGMRRDRETAAIADPEEVVRQYEDAKRAFRPPGAELPTEEACLREGFAFIPMVMEAHGGGWGAAARSVIGAVARCVAATRNVEPAVVSLDIAQRISIALHTENARAILKRRLWVGDEWDAEEPGEVSPDADMARAAVRAAESGRALGGKSRICLVGGVSPLARPLPTQRVAPGRPPWGTWGYTKCLIIWLDPLSI